MPLKFNKELSVHLFKYIKSVDLSFNPFDNRTRSIRELMRQMQAKATKYDKLKLNIDVNAAPNPPAARFLFADGTEQKFETNQFVVNEIMFQVHLKAMQLDADYELEGKSIEDE